MNPTARCLCLTAASLATLALAQSPPSSGLVDVRAARDAAVPEATPGRFVLHDVVCFANGEPMALITDLGPRARTMFFQGDMAPAGCSIKEITREHVVLVDRRSGREIELKVAGASTGDPAASAAARRNGCIPGRTPCCTAPSTSRAAFPRTGRA